MKIAPLTNIVIIRRSAPDCVSAGGIYMAWDEDYKEDIGVVFATGVDCKHVKPGDTVLFSTNGHQIVTLMGEELIVTKEPSIIGVITGMKDGVESGTRSADRSYAGVN